MRLIKLFTAVAAALLVAGSAQALVSLSTPDDLSGALAPGATFTINLDVNYDGSPASLTGIFVSAQWDPSVIQLTSAVSPNFTILFGGTGFLSKLSDPFNASGDPAGTIRAISYGANPGQTAGAGAAPATTTLTFEAIGGGSTSVDLVYLTGDGIIAGGDTVQDPSLLGPGISVVVPEPGTALLMGLGLAGLAGAGRRQA